MKNDSLYACIDNVNFVSVQVDQFVMSFDTAFSYTSVATQLGLDYELVVSGTFHDTLWVPYQDAAYNWNSANPNIGFTYSNNPWSGMAQPIIDQVLMFMILSHIPIHIHLLEMAVLKFLIMLI